MRERAIINGDGEKTVYQTFLKSLDKLKIHRTIIAIGILILFIQYVWKYFYIWRSIPGVYWLFFYLDTWFLESIGFCFIAAVVVLILWLVSKILKSDYSSALMKIVGALTFTGIAILLTFPAFAAHNTVFVDRLEANGATYYLSAYPFFSEVNYGLAECESAGIICKTIFLSGDITGTNWLNSHLNYDENSKKLLLIEDIKGVIFSKQVP